MEFLNRFQQPMLSCLRIMTGALFLDEGSAKVFHWPYTPRFDHVVLFHTWPTGIAGPLEVIFGPLVILGFYSRYAAFLASGLTAIAYFIAHAPQGFHPFLNDGSLAALYSFTFLYLACAGPGPWAINRK